MKRLLWVGLVLTAALAATGYRLKCADKDCKYETRVTFGPTKLTTRVTGWCVKCAKFQTVSWINREFAGQPAEKPIEPLGKVWDPESGQTKAVYACPACKGPMLEIGSGKELKHCPKCGGEKVELRAEMAID